MMTKDVLSIDLSDKTITIPDDVKTVMITLREEQAGEAPSFTLKAADGLNVILVLPAEAEGKPRTMSSALSSDGTSSLSADVNHDGIDDIHLILPKGAITHMMGAKDVPLR